MRVRRRPRKHKGDVMQPCEDTKAYVKLESAQYAARMILATTKERLVAGKCEYRPGYHLYDA